MKKLMFSFAALATFATGAVAAQSFGNWEIGPVINGRNYSPGMPPVMTNNSFDFSTNASGHVHYVTTPVRSLAGAKSVTLRYRIDAEPGTRFVAQEHPTQRAILSLYFQRRGDNWRAGERFGGHRWYSARAKTLPLRPGTHTITVRFDREQWIPVSRRGNPDFDLAMGHAHRVGFVFGSGGGRGHGVYATAPARFTLLDFDIR